MKRGLWLLTFLLLVNTSHASELPTFDFTQTCAAEGGGRSNFRTCMAAQRAARRNLQNSWRRYSEAQKTSCVAEASGIAGVASSDVEC